MKTLQTYLLPTVFILSLTLIMGCTQTEGPAAQEETSIVEAGSLSKGGPSANGQGSLTTSGNRIFAFHAVTHPNGNVSGNGVLNITPSGIRVHFDIDCLSVSGNVATMSGTSPKSPASPQFVGGPFWFKVVDNGEGANADPDEITLFFFCLPDLSDPPCPPGCGVDVTLPGLGPFPIEAGNIQVKS